tara:strand:+ start:15829 stop:17538 length:1710 start_codon:yes stop_codon:yes gene_type:complete
MNVIFLDFDKYYFNREIPKNHYVLSSNYEKLGVVSVLNYTSCRKLVYNHFDQIFETNKNLNQIFLINKMILFLNFFYPFGQWIYAIKNLISEKELDKNKIKIVFSSFSNNSNISLFEAEGEINSSFLYHKSYFLSFYIKMYLKKIGINKFQSIRDRTFKSKLYYYLRGIIVVNFKLIQLLFYKIFVVKRNYINNLNSNSSKIILSSRGVVHTQFLQSILSALPNDTIAFINEGLARPFRNYKNIKKNKFNFYYCEGLLSFSQIFNLYFSAIKTYLYKNSNVINFMNLDIDLNKLLPELSIFEFNMKSYSISLLNAKNKMNKSFSFNKIISFELLFPFAHYLKNNLNLKTVQVQTIAIYKDKYPNFIYADKFYFSNDDDFNYHSKNNTILTEKCFKLENLKYLGINKSSPKKIIRKVVYFTQPIYENDEINLLIFLKKFCEFNNFQLSIKLHPRSKPNKFNFLKVPFIGSNISSIVAIRNSDLVITRDSAIGFDSWFLNVPILFFLNGMLKGEDLPYIPHDYKGKFSELPSIISLSKKINSIIKQFYSHNYHTNFEIDKKYIIKELLSFD